ncbi:hypothetical protein MesoLjLc_65350 [Mesorhizobium sp. L-8-10]|uniref:hypothetical protein n=1 Tax=unclassified Mesorhizobium TaxID=325217 RepID=UPI0019263F32|nr:MULTISPECIES: hypothetical protein [unclassified Mesorhizobium]BCH26622.1 hypothetical protein MesoLjLb_64070 [Mesorhizobium sp. L-8-3]BCH34605.1 hypothetical protein MesoLjLc_65350 [Mesorhizobium sp. L-8-10]
MAISPGIVKCGVFRPHELAFLQEVFDGCLPKSLGGEADAVARRLISAYQSGMRDRDLLRLTAIGNRSGASRPQATEVGADAA